MKKNIKKEGGRLLFSGRGFGVLVLAMSCCATNVGFANDDLPEPDWSNQDGLMTFQQFNFLTDAVSGVPDASSNAFGQAEFSVTVIPEGAFGEGWQDPDGDGLARDNNGGTWDVGPEGSILVSVPIGEITNGGSFPGFNVEFLVNVIGLQGDPFAALPVLSFPGQADVSESQVSEGIVEAAGIAGNWTYRSWSGGAVQGVQQETLNFLISSVPDPTSLIDSIEIYTNATVIPEPRVYALFFGLAVGFLVVARRRSRG